MIAETGKRCSPSLPESLASCHSDRCSGGAHSRIRPTICNSDKTRRECDQHGAFSFESTILFHECTRLTPSGALGANFLPPPALAFP